MDFPQTMNKTRKEMSDLGLPGGWKKDHATVVEDRMIDQSRWSTIHELIFRLPGMPDDLAYQTTYSHGSTEYQDEAPWEDGDAVCTLVRQVERVIKVWIDAEPASAEAGTLTPEGPSQ